MVINGCLEVRGEAGTHGVPGVAFGGSTDFAVSVAAGVSMVRDVWEEEVGMGGDFLV